MNNFDGDFKLLLQQDFEKTSIRRLSRTVGFALLLLFGIMVGWSFITIRIVALFGIDSSQAINFLTHPIVSQMIQIVVSFLMFVPTFILAAKISGSRISSLISFGKPEKNATFPLFLAGLGFCYFANIASSQFCSILEALGFEIPQGDVELSTGISGFLLSVIATSVIPALVEEFAMRGVVMGLLRRFGDGFAIIGSAAVFGIMHANIPQIPFAFLVGLALAFITIKSNSIWPAVAIHAANNFISVCFSYLQEYMPIVDVNIIYFLLCSVFLWCFIFASFKFFGKNTNVLSLSAPNLVSNSGKRIAWFLLDPVMIIAIIISVLVALFLR